MLRYLSERLSDQNLSGSGILDVMVNTLSETVKYIQSSSESNLSKKDNSIKYQLLQIIENLQAQLSNIASIEVSYFPNKTKTDESNDADYANIENKKLMRFFKKSLSTVESRRLKLPTAEKNTHIEEDVRQISPKTNIERRKFQMLRPVIKKTKSSGYDNKRIYRERMNTPTYCNSEEAQVNNKILRPRKTLLRRAHSSENVLTSNTNLLDEPIYDLPRKSKISTYDSDIEAEGYMNIKKSEQLMPNAENGEKVVKVKLKANGKDLGNRFCILRDHHLLIGEELNGSVAEYECLLTQYSLNYEMCNKENLSLCISNNELNLILCFKSEEEYEQWEEDINNAILKERYTSVRFSSQTLENVYDSVDVEVEPPIYERISLMLEESQKLSLEPKSL
ncbi:hypothetical protein LOD99_4295 [Oopsacas minuta]|uniref:PH domain-containing protein n=1 Tax=Oopsacas minuta TaxID=111878 RepID=A0AAV7JWN1_9METZ|nr:hypothetical protein LOD99_4295 [Oopsacas minuta]